MQDIKGENIVKSFLTTTYGVAMLIYNFPMVLFLSGLHHFGYIQDKNKTEKEKIYQWLYISVFSSFFYFALPILMMGLFSE